MLEIDYNIRVHDWRIEDVYMIGEWKTGIMQLIHVFQCLFRTWVLILNQVEESLLHNSVVCEAESATSSLFL